MKKFLLVALAALVLPLAVSAASKPVIQSFTASPTSFVEGGSAVLTWDVTGANSVSINNGIGNVNKTTGYKVVQPAVTTTYILSASNRDGTVTKSVTVTVNAPMCQEPDPVIVAPPVIQEFALSHPNVQIGGTSYLNWNVSGATSVFIEPSGTEFPSGSLGFVGPVSSNQVIVSPTVDTAFTLTAGNGHATTSKSVVMTVSERPAVECDLQVTPEIMRTDNMGDVTLTWTTSPNTQVVYFYPMEEFGQPPVDLNISPTQVNGSKTISGLTHSTAFAMTAVGPYGYAKYCLAMMMVSGPL